MSQDTGTPIGTGLRAAQVDDVMSAPLVTCLPSVSLREVAELMIGHRIHAVVVLGGPSREEDVVEWGVVSELDLVGGACMQDADIPAGRVAATPAVVVGPDESLERAAMLMAEYQVTHLIAVERGRAVGIVSALDVARALASGVPRPERPSAEDADAALIATPGDRLVIRGHHLGEADRDAEILEARGPRGGPPFLVRWEDGGRVSLLYPGSDARVEGTGRR